MDHPLTSITLLSLDFLILPYWHFFVHILLNRRDSQRFYSTFFFCHALIPFRIDHHLIKTNVRNNVSSQGQVWKVLSRFSWPQPHFWTQNRTEKFYLDSEVSIEHYSAHQKLIQRLCYKDLTKAMWHWGKLRTHAIFDTKLRALTLISDPILVCMRLWQAANNTQD